MDLQGQTVHDRYLVEALIGEGGDAFVYRAYDRGLGRPVALKLLRPELRADPTFVTRFEREAQSAARLNHPHIVPVYDYGEAAGTYFLVMEYVPGGDLRARLRPGQPFPLAFAVRLAAEVADALAAAHAHGIVHRDIKPANILLDERDHARVTDFGIAKMLDVPALTATAALLGTPHYLAPEQATGAPITPATDVYALGVVLYEMLAGRRPFEGESFVQVAMQHLHAEPPPLPQPAVPAALAALVRRALAKDPAARFPDGAALAAALVEQARALGVAVTLTAPQPGPVPSTPPALEPAPAAVAADPTPSPSAGRPRPAPPRLHSDRLRAVVGCLQAAGARARARPPARRPPRPAPAARPGPVALLSVVLVTLAIGFVASRLLLGGTAAPAASVAESAPAPAPPRPPAGGLPAAPLPTQPPTDAPTPTLAAPPALTPAAPQPEAPERHAVRSMPALEPPPTAAPPLEPEPSPTPAPPARQPAVAAPVVARTEPAELPARPPEVPPATAPAPPVEAPPAASPAPAPPPPAPPPRPSAPAPAETPLPTPPPPAPEPPVARPAPPPPTAGPPAGARPGRRHGENPPGRQRAPAPVPQAPPGYPPSYPPPWVPPYGPFPPFGVWPGPPPMGPPGFVPPGPAPLPPMPGAPDGAPIPRY